MFLSLSAATTPPRDRRHLLKDFAVKILSEQDRFHTQPGPFGCRCDYWILIFIFIIVLLPWALILIVIVAWASVEVFSIYVAIRQFIPTKS